MSRRRRSKGRSKGRRSPRLAKSSGDQAFEGCSTIPALFALCVHRAAPLLDSGFIARLATTPIGRIPQLSLASAAVVRRARALVANWAARSRQHRYQLRAPQRDQLLAVLGARRLERVTDLLLVAFLLGDAFAAVRRDHRFAGVRAQFEAAGVLPTVPAFLGEIGNPAPPLGQMTAMASLRRWCGAMWLSGDLRALRALGPTPRPTPSPLPPRVDLALRGAIASDELRLAAVSWRLHSSGGVQLAPNAPAGTFAVQGLNAPAAPQALTSVVQVLAQERVHVALFPELMLERAELAQLQQFLKARGGKFPVLTIAGLSHSPPTAGNSAFVNAAVVLDSTGTVIHEHHKLEPFTHPQLGTEAIVPRESDAYGYLDTPVGRLVVNICRDVRSDVPMVLNRLLQPSLLFVPALSAELSFAAEEARVLGARQATITVVANPVRPASDPESLKELAHLYVPVRGRTVSADTVLPAGFTGPTALVTTWAVLRGATGSQARSGIANV